MKIPDATPRGPNDSCYRVLIRDRKGRLWNPIVRATDDAMLVAKPNKTRKTMWLPGNPISGSSVLGSGVDARTRNSPTELVSSSCRSKSSGIFMLINSLFLLLF